MFFIKKKKMCLKLFRKMVLFVFEHILKTLQNIFVLKQIKCVFIAYLLLSLSRCFQSFESKNDHDLLGFMSVLYYKDHWRETLH